MEELFVSMHCFKLDFSKCKINKKELAKSINEMASKISRKGVFISRQYLSIKHNTDLILFNIADSFDTLLLFKSELMELFVNELNETYSIFQSMSIQMLII